MKDLYGLTTLRYNSLLSAIPLEWKSYFQENVLSTILAIRPHLYDKVVGNQIKGFSAKVYKFISGDAIEIHNKFMKWRHDIGHDFCETLIDFGQEHRNIYSLTNVPKFRSFQYRLLQRGIVTNIHLYRWNIISSSSCSFCKDEDETLTHLFFECAIVKDLWNIIIDKYIVKEIGVDHQELHLNLNNIVLNKIHGKKNHIVNFICLVTKQFIYRQRCLKENLIFPNWRNYVSNIKNIEKYIAIKNNRLKYHLNNWQCDMSLESEL